MRNICLAALLCLAMSQAANAEMTAWLQPEGPKVVLAWDPNPETDLEGYRLYRAVVAATPVFSQVGDVKCGGNDDSCTNFTDATVQLGTQYRYYATAYNQAGQESGPSDTVDIWVTTKPAPPTGLTIELQGVNVAFFWESDCPSCLFLVYKRADPAADFHLFEITATKRLEFRWPPGHRRNGALAVKASDPGRGDSDLAIREVAQ